MSQILNAMNWRYATKAFDINKKLTNEQVGELIEATRLSASSYGLQPWKLIEVKSPELRAKVREASWNQSQVTDASNLFIFAIQKNVDEAYVDKFISLVASERGLETSMLKGYSDMMKGAIKSKGPLATKDWSARQAYIALGTLLETAAILNIDACPMEGFDSKKADEILGLANLGLESVVMCPVGYRLDSDETAKYKKVRFPKSEIVVEL